MSLTYKTVIEQAMKGFNDIQKKIYGNSGQLVTPNNSTDAGVSSLSEIIAALGASTVSVSDISGTSF